MLSKNLLSFFIFCLLIIQEVHPLEQQNPAHKIKQEDWVEDISSHPDIAKAEKRMLEITETL